MRLAVPQRPCSSCRCSPGRCRALWVRGPDTVRGFLGGSVSVNCTYQLSNEMNPKFWCYLGLPLFICRGDYTIITSEDKPMVQQGRLSIRDNRALRVFTVTMKDLTQKDAGTYLCGVRTGTFYSDKSHRVKVIVSPGQYLWVPQVQPWCLAGQVVGAGAAVRSSPEEVGAQAPWGSPRLCHRGSASCSHSRCHLHPFLMPRFSPQPLLGSPG
uniref:Immunoglobulin domain-containing protein n=1 Tax=Calidris pygmaea TaxID=425635 RepID=A0A8C3JKU8_9CHAR